MWQSHSRPGRTKRRPRPRVVLGCPGDAVPSDVDAVNPSGPRTVRRSRRRPAPRAEVENATSRLHQVDGCPDPSLGVDRVEEDVRPAGREQVGLPQMDVPGDASEFVHARRTPLQHRHRAVAACSRPGRRRCSPARRAPSAVTSSPRCAGRSCMNTARGLAAHQRLVDLERSENARASWGRLAAFRWSATGWCRRRRPVAAGRPGRAASSTHAPGSGGRLAPSSTKRGSTP